MWTEGDGRRLADEARPSIEQLQQELDKARAQIVRVTDALRLLWQDHCTDDDGNILFIDPIDPELVKDLEEILAEGREPWKE